MACARAGAERPCAHWTNLNIAKQRAADAQVIADRRRRRVRFRIRKPCAGLQQCHRRRSLAVATATVRVIPDRPSIAPTSSARCSRRQRQRYQDKGDRSGGVRVVSARGLIATTDKYGRYHITCAVVPNENRGRLILKLDERSLPSGYRTTTENPLVKRVTRGKMMKFNFGAGVHRIVRLDISDAVFETEDDHHAPQWTSRMDILLAELRSRRRSCGCRTGRRRGGSSSRSSASTASSARSRPVKKGSRLTCCP